MNDGNYGYQPRRRSRYADIPVAGEPGAPASNASVRRTAPSDIGLTGNGYHPQRGSVPLASNVPGSVSKGPVPPQTSPASSGEDTPSVQAGAADAVSTSDRARYRVSDVMAGQQGPAASSRNPRPNPRKRTAGSRGRKSEPTRPPRGVLGDVIATHRSTLLIVGVVLGVLLLVGIIDSVANWGKIYAGVRVGNVDVSGMTVEEAERAIDATYGTRITAADIGIYADEETFGKAKKGEEIEDLQSSEYISSEEAAKNRKVWRVTAISVQARLNAQDLANQAFQVGRDDGGITERLGAQTFGHMVEPTVQMNGSALESLARSIDRALGDAHEDYNIAIEDGVAYVTKGHDGEEIDRSWLRQNLVSQFLGEAEEEGFVAQVEHAPIRIDEQAAQAVADRVNRGIENGTTFTFEGAQWEAGAYDLGILITTKIQREGEGWELVPSYDESATKAAIRANLQTAFTNQDIKVEFSQSEDGSVMVHTNATGSMPEVGQAVEKLGELTLESQPTGTPVIPVEGTQIPASMSIQAAMDYGIVSTISQFETEYTGGATNRNTNIHLAADLINNSIVKANGGAWSFNGTAGECNEEKGFQGAGAIVGGETVDEIGGGICQVATTVFNAVFEAGFPVVDRTNHSLFIASYPEGRDAAVSWPDLDLVWRNDSPNDVLLQTSWTDTTITVTLLGVDPGYAVASETGEFKDGARYSIRTEVDEELPEGSMQVKQAGQDGGSIEVTRIVKNASGQILSQDRFVSVYDAKDEIIQIGPNTEVDPSLFTRDDEPEAEGEGEDAAIDDTADSDADELELELA